MAVKMPPTRSRTERPYAPLLYAVTVYSVFMLSVSGRLRPRSFGDGRVANETPPLKTGNTNLETHDLGERHWPPVSFTGAVSSQRVTEECEVWLNPVGNRVTSTWI